MTDPKDKPKTASLLSTMTPETSRWRTRNACCLCRAWWVNTPTAGRSWRRTAATVRTSPGRRRLVRSRTRIRSSAWTSKGRSRCFAQPKARGRRAAAKPLAELGDDPVTKREVVVRSGRFGLYVTDGETNATLRLGDTPETLTLDRASELLAERRNAEPSTRVRGPRRRRPRRRPRSVRRPSQRRVTTKKTAGQRRPRPRAAATKRVAVAKGAGQRRAAERRAATTRDPGAVLFRL
jgi:hypothetical protein